MASMKPDAQLLQLIQQAGTLRDKSRDTEIQMRTAANIARQQADVAKAQALELSVSTRLKSCKQKLLPHTSIMFGLSQILKHKYKNTSQA